MVAPLNIKLPHTAIRTSTNNLTVRNFDRCRCVSNIYEMLNSWMFICNSIVFLWRRCTRVNCFIYPLDKYISINQVINDHYDPSRHVSFEGFVFSSFAPLLAFRTTSEYWNPGMGGVSQIGNGRSEGGGVSSISIAFSNKCCGNAYMASCWYHILSVRS